MRDSINSFLNHLVVEKGFSQNTLDAYRNDLYQLEEYVRGKGVQRWEAVTTPLLMDYAFDIRANKGYRDTTAARKVAAARSFFAFLQEEGLVKADPAETISSPRVGRNLPKFLSEQEVERLLDKAAEETSPDGRRDWAILELLYATGLRVSELVSLNLADTNLKEGYIRCLGKGSRERIVYIYPRAVEALKTYLEEGRPALVDSQEEKALFVNRRGERLTRQWVWVIVKDQAKKAGIEMPLTPHVLRHSFATHMLRGGASLRHVQELLGHSTISTTQVYTHLTNDHLRQEYDKSHPRS